MLIERTFRTFGLAGAVRWWLVPIAIEREPADDLRADLDALELQRLAHYRQRADRARFATVRATLRRLLGERLGLAPRDVAFEPGVRGKPCLHVGCDSGGGRADSDGGYARDARRWHFNVSHSGAWGAIVIAPGSACEAVGIDIEQCLPVAPMPLADVAFSAREAGHLAAMADERARLERFYQLWTVREAYAKATATGIAEPRWQTTTFVPAAGGQWHADDGGATLAWSLPLPDDLAQYQAALALTSQTLTPTT